MNTWITFAEAAKALVVDVRTIKRWVRCLETREAISAVRHSGKWRICAAEGMWAWEFETRQRLEMIGSPLLPAWQAELRKVGRECDRYLLEANRLWLASYAKVVERGRVTLKARSGILLLWQAACKILENPSQGQMQVDELKTKFPRELLRYWPQEKHFSLVRNARTMKKLESIRRRLDLVHATRCLKRGGKNPTAENLRPLLHKDLVTHINDTGEKLPAFVRDLRRPQEGLALRTFRERHPLKQEPQIGIIAGVYRIRSSVPGAAEGPRRGKTPISNDSGF